MKDTSVAAFRRQTISESCLNGQRLALIGFVLFVYHHYYHHHDRQWTLVSFRFLSLSLSLPILHYWDQNMEFKTLSYLHNTATALDTKHPAQTDSWVCKW